MEVDKELVVKKAIVKKAKKKHRIITDAVVEKILKKSGGSVRMSGAAKRLLKSALVNKGLQYFKRGEKVRESLKMSTLMKDHVQLSRELEVSFDLLPQGITKHQPLKTLI